MRAYHVAFAVGLLGSACSDPLAPGDGAISISLSVQGVDGDQNGYLLTVDGRHPTTMTGPGTATVALSPGHHTVQLLDLAPNCSSDGPESERVEVSPSDTAQVDFSVSCHALTGVVEVSVATSGPDQDMDGYYASLDGAAPRLLFGSAVVRYTGVGAGTHTVSLSGSAANCSIAGPNPRNDVTVQTGGLTRDTAHVVFQVGCSATTGTIRIITATTGLGLDTNGYLVSITPGMNLPRQIFPNDTLVVWGLAPGSTTVGLGNLASYCTVSGAAQVPVTVVLGDTVDVRFGVNCTGPGTVRVTTSTAGTATDPSYTLTIDGSPAQSIASAETVLRNLLIGQHSVGLSDVAFNCTVSGTNPVPVAVTEGDTLDVAFDVTCVTPGTAQVTAATSGPDADASYSVTVDGAGPTFLPGNGTVSLGLIPGTHSIALSDVAPNCTVAGANPVVVDVAQGATVNVTFTVTCTPIPPSGVSFTFATTGSDPDNSYYLTVCYWGCYYYESSWEGTVPANGTVPITLPAGSYDYYLTDVAGNCTTTEYGGFTVSTGQTTPVNVSVACAPAANLTVTAPTYGQNPNGGYTVIVDGAYFWVYTDRPLSLTQAAGHHTVQLTGLPLGCVLAGSSSVDVDLVAGTTTSVVFNVTCGLVGGIQASVQPAGTDVDSIYRVNLDGLYAAWVYPGLPAAVTATQGTHSVQLVDVAANCTVTSPNPAVVTVPTGAIVDVSFTVDCVPNPTLRATVTTTGQNQPAGYLVGVDLDYYYGWTYSVNAPANGQATIRLPVGSHYVGLDQVPLNCTVTSPNNLQVNLALGSITDVAFTVSCQ